MAFTLINSAQIAAGEPTSQDLFTAVKDSLDDHESRMTVLESANNLYRPISFDFVGLYSTGLIGDGKMSDIIRFDSTVLNVILFIHTAGSSGTTSIDIEYKRGAGSFSSILSAPISIAYSAGDYQTLAGTLAVTSLLTSDIIRVNVDDAQHGGIGFSVLLEYEVA